MWTGYKETVACWKATVTPGFPSSASVDVTRDLREESAVPAASGWMASARGAGALRRRPSAWPPHRGSHTVTESGTASAATVALQTGPISARFETGFAVTGLSTTGSLTLHLLASPSGPHRLAVPARPAHVGPLPPSPALPGSGCPQASPGRCDGPGDGLGVGVSIVQVLADAHGAAPPARRDSRAASTPARRRHAAFTPSQVPRPPPSDTDHAELNGIAGQLPTEVRSMAAAVAAPNAAVITATYRSGRRRDPATRAATSP
jgi:hypothetical protein